jgi:hypothetical protein
MTVFQLSNCELAKNERYQRKLTGNGVTSGTINFEVRAQNFPEPKFDTQKAIVLCVDHPAHYRVDESLAGVIDRVFPDITSAMSYAKQQLEPDIFVHIVTLRIDPENIEQNEELKNQLCCGTVEAYQRTTLTSRNRVIFDRSNVAIYGPLEYGTKQQFHIGFGVTNLVFNNIIFSAAGTSKKETELYFHPDSQVHLINCCIKGNIIMHNCASWLQNCRIENLSKPAAITIGEVDDREESTTYHSNILSPVITDCEIIGHGKSDIGILFKKFSFVTPDQNPAMLHSYRDVDHFHQSDFGSSLADDSAIQEQVFSGTRFKNCSKNYQVQDVINLTETNVENFLMRSAKTSSLLLNSNSRQKNKL